MAVQGILQYPEDREREAVLPYLKETFVHTHTDSSAQSNNKKTKKTRKNIIMHIIMAASHIITVCVRVNYMESESSFFSSV